MWFPNISVSALRTAWFAAALSLFIGCHAQERMPGAMLPYRLDKPAMRIELADELHEISGLEIAPDGKSLLAVQDERGAIFVLDGKTMQIKQHFDFGPNGDFEGITAVGDTVYAVKSNGTVFRVIRGGTPEQTVEKFNNTLIKQHNIEGIAADPVRRLLLLACKDAPPGQSPDEKHVYAISMDDMSLHPEPYLRIHQADMITFLQQNHGLPQRTKLLEYLTRPEFHDGLRFSPSGIAIHPHSGHYYILSAPGRMLAVYDRQGMPVALHQFHKSIFQQPEGICFDSNGTLYIASEGKENSTGVIAVFPMQSVERGG